MKKKEAQSKFYKALYQNSFEASFVIDGQGEILEYNQAFSQLFHPSEYQPAEGQRIKSIFSFPDMYNKLMEELSLGESIHYDDVELLNMEGDHFNCCIKCSAIKDEETTDQLFQGVIYNTSERIEKQSELQFAQTMATSRQIARSMGHEIRNPLTNLNLALEQLTEELSTDEDTQLYIDIISRNASRIEQLMAEMLESTKPKEVNLSRQDVNKLVAGWVKKLANHIGEENDCNKNQLTK